MLYFAAKGTGAENMSMEVGAVVRLRNRLWRTDHVRDEEFTDSLLQNRT